MVEVLNEGQSLGKAGGIMGNLEAPALTQQSVSDSQARHTPDAKDIVIFCPRSEGDGGAVEAAYALMYLPERYKLILGVEDPTDVSLREANALRTYFKDRISIHEHNSGTLSEASPFSFANIVVYGRNDPAFSGTTLNSLVVFDLDADRDMNDDQNRNNVRTCASTPEALASAILKLSH